MDDWDPMSENFYDNSNSYDIGPRSRLPRHKQPVNFRKEESQLTKLYVAPLSEGFTKESLRNIFLKFGAVSDVFLHPSYRWGFVSMKTLGAAERAIRDLNDDPQLKFKVKFAKEKLDCPSVAASESGSSSEINHRKSEDVTQSRSQFIDSSKRKSINDRDSMAERSVPEMTERTKSESSHQKSPIMNGDIVYQTVPNCCHCKCSALDSCSKCHKPFCSINCMILGYNGHTDGCVKVPELNSQSKTPSTNVPNDVSPTIHQTYPDNNRNDLNYYKQPSDGDGNFRKSNCMNDLGARYPKNNSQDVRNGRSTTTPNVRAFEAHENDNRYSRNTPSDDRKSTKMDDDIYITFNVAKDGKKNTNVQRETDRKFNYSNEESKSSLNNRIHVSNYHSKTDNVSSRDRQSQIPGKRSNNENALSRSTQSQVSKYPKENDFSKDNRSRVSESCVNDGNESSWETQSLVGGYNSKSENRSFKENRSAVSGYHSKKETNLSRDNRSRVSRNNVNNERESSWETKSQVSEYHSKENDSPRDNQSENRPNGKNKSSCETSPSVSAYHSKKDNDVSRENRSRVNKENESSWEARSLASGYYSCSEKSTKNNRSYETGSVGRSYKPKKFEENRKSDDSARSPTHLIDLCPKKPDLSSLFRVDIRENDKFEVKLAESGPPAVLIVQESGSLNSMIDILQEFSLEPIDNIRKGQKCVVKKTPDDYGTWYRGLIVEADPLVVKFIDFSFERVKVRREDVRIIPEKFTSMNPFCYPVNFMNALIDEVKELKNTTFEVVFLSKEYGTWNVNFIKPCKEEPKETGKSDSHVKVENVHRSRPDLKVILKKDVPVKVFVTYIDSCSKKIFVTIQEKLHKLVSLIGDISPPLADLQEFRLNTICLALFEDSWYRAKIISVTPLEVYYIDFGNTEPADKSDLKMLPDEYKKIDPLVVPVKFRNGSKSSVGAEQTVEIIPIEESASERIWIVRLTEEPEILENPVLESSERFGDKSYAPKVALDEIMEVQVTYTISNTEYYVGPKNMNELLQMGITDEEIEKLGSLKKPSIGTLCVKNYENLWSRAKIVELEPLTIYYIDFGNEEEANIEELYPLAEKYHHIPPVAFKIHLQEPKKLPEYEPLKIKKVTDKFWTVVDES